MSLACSLTPLGNRFGGHFAGDVIADLSAGAGQNMRFVKGLYFIRGQAAGGWGGNNFMANGGGGGSGAAFEGYVHINRDLENVAVLSGAVPEKQGDGGQTSVSGIFVFGGGRVGGYNNGVGGLGGEYAYNTDERWSIASSRVARNGEDGRGASSDGNYRSGANSVLTGSGGGLGQAPATAPGAGGGGGYQWHPSGQPGGPGEIKIQYIREYV